MADSKIKCTSTQHQMLSSFIPFEAWIEVTTVVVGFFFFQLEYSCLVMLCWFLLYNSVKQLYVHVYPLPLGPPSHPPSCPSGPSQSAVLSLCAESLCCAACFHWLSVLYMAVYICQARFTPPSPATSTDLFSTPVSLFLPYT